MHISVLIEPLAGNGYRVKAGEPFAFTAEGPTRDEALRLFREKVQERLTAGAELVSLEVPADNPWPRMYGAFRDDPDFDEWQQAIAEYRRQIEEDPETR